MCRGAENVVDDVSERRQPHQFVDSRLSVDELSAAEEMANVALVLHWHGGVFLVVRMRADRRKSMRFRLFAVSTFVPPS